MNKTIRFHLGLVAAVTLPLLACGTAENVVQARDMHVEIGASPGGGTVVNMGGVRLEVQTDVKLTLPIGFKVHMRVDGRTYLENHDGPEILIDGRPVGAAEPFPDQHAARRVEVR